MSTVTWTDGTTRTWSGTSKCLCYSCRQLFGSISGFTKHQKGGKCHDPAKVGLQLVDDVWRFPATTGVASGRFGPSKESSGH
jgi:hypothetical protein